MLLLVAPTPALAQGSVEDLYQRAMQCWNQQDVDCACEQFKKIQAESPGYKDVPRLMVPACAASKKLYEGEQTRASQCSDLYQKGQFDDAKAACQTALDISKKLQHPQYRDRVVQILKAIDANAAESARAGQKQQQCAKIFQDATALASLGRAEEARDRFSQVVQMGCSQASDAQTRIGQIDAQLRSKLAGADREKRAEEAFSDCSRLYNSHDLRGAQGRCQEVVRLNGRNRAEAEKVLAKITQELANNAGGTPGGPSGGKTPPPGPSEVSGNEDLLRAGLRAYFNGDYADAETSLTRYLNSHGAKSALAYFFRGATHGSRYILSGEKESDQKSQALADFRDANIQRLASKPSEKFVSPKILALYQEALTTGSH